MTAMSMVHYVTEAFDSGESAEMIMCDLSKAFDTVPHGTLLNKLEYYGVR